MSLKISEFRAVISKHRGVSRNNKFEVILPSLPGFSGDAQDLRFLCSAAGIPGVTINSTKRKTGVLDREHATDMQIENITLTFNETSDGFVREYFDYWMGLIINPVTRNVSYRDDYVKNIQIKTFNEAGLDHGGLETYNILRNCWPDARPTVEYSDSSRDTVTQISISMSVEDYISSNTEGIRGT